MKKHWISRKEAGAQFLEYALGVPIFFSVVLAVCYFGLWMLTNGIVDTALGRAVTIATTAVEFEEPRAECDLSSSSEGTPQSGWCLGMQRIKDAMLDLPVSQGLITVGQEGGFAYAPADAASILLPEPVDGQSQRAAFISEPIVLRLTYYVVNPVGLIYSAFDSGASSYVQVQRTAVAYREQITPYSGTLKVDCAGIPFGMPDYGKGPCDCSSEPNTLWFIDDQGVGSCHTCQFDRAIEDNPNEFYHGTDDYGCYCPTTSFCVDKYGPGSVGYSVGANQCRCGCYANTGFEGGLESECTCTEPPPSPPPDYGGSTSLTFLPERERVGEGESWKCICKVDNGSVGGEPLSEQHCMEIHGLPADRVKVAPDGCSCWCQDNRSCPPNSTLSYGQRPWTNGNTSWIYYNPECQCKCQGNREWSGEPEASECVCISDSCPENQTRDPATCECGCQELVCAHGGVAVQAPGGNCYCQCPCGTEPDGQCAQCSGGSQVG